MVALAFVKLVAVAVVGVFKIGALARGLVVLLGLTAATIPLDKLEDHIVLYVPILLAPISSRSVLISIFASSCWLFLHTCAVREATTSMVYEQDTRTGP